MASRPSDKLVRFAAGINRGLSGREAAKEAGYGSHVISTPGATLERARRAGLVLTIEEARAPLELIKAAVTPEDWTAITKKAVADAKEGDPVARAWLSDRLIGKPVQAIEHSGRNGGPIRHAVDFGYSDEANDGSGQDDSI